MRLPKRFLWHGVDPDYLPTDARAHPALKQMFERELTRLTPKAPPPRRSIPTKPRPVVFKVVTEKKPPKFSTMLPPRYDDNDEAAKEELAERSRLEAAARVRRKRKAERDKWQRELTEPPLQPLQRPPPRSVDMADRAAAAAGLPQSAAAAARARSWLDIARKRAALYSHQAREDRIPTIFPPKPSGGTTADRVYAVAYEEAMRQARAASLPPAYSKSTSYSHRRSSAGEPSTSTPPLHHHHYHSYRSSSSSSEKTTTPPLFHQDASRRRPAAPPSHYDVLGVDKSATSTELKKAYYRLARQVHPDRNQTATEATSRMSRINEAYGCLTDPARRLLYDADRDGDLD